MVSATSLFEPCASQHVDKTKRRGKVLAAQEGETARFLHCLLWFCWGSILHVTTPPLRVMRAARFTCSWLESCVTYEQFRFSGREARFLRSNPILRLRTPARPDQKPLSHYFPMESHRKTFACSHCVTPGSESFCVFQRLPG